MATSTANALHAYTDCLTKVAAQNRAIYEDIMRRSGEVALAFMHHRLERDLEAADRLRHTASEFFNAEQGLIGEAMEDWAQQAQKLRKMMWDTAEDGMRQTVEAATPLFRAPVRAQQERAQREDEEEARQAAA
jgi:hypothetical protein